MKLDSKNLLLLLVIEQRLQNQLETLKELTTFSLTHGKLLFFRSNKVCVENINYDDYAEERVEIFSEDLYNKFIKFILDLAKVDETMVLQCLFLQHLPGFKLVAYQGLSAKR